MKYITGIICLLAIFEIALCDIPVHCLKSQIAGRWKIYASRPNRTDNLYSFTCGHTMPSHEGDAYTHTRLIPEINFDLNLNFNDKALLSMDGFPVKQGNWTMIYNEGFDVLVEDYSFLAFSKYSLNDGRNPEITSRWVSKCYSTLIGWYHKGDQWGCFYAEKISGGDPNQVTNGEPGNKLLVVENTVQTISNRVEPANGFNDYFTPTSLLVKQESFTGDFNDDETFFLEAKATSKLKLTNEFKNHEQVVQRLNQMNNLWKATNYDQFKSMSIEELNTFAGRKKSSHFIPEEFRFKSVETADKTKKVKKDLSLLKKLSNYHLNHKKTFLRSESFANGATSDLHYSDLPKEHKSWVNIMNRARNQGSCGSCYTVAALNMLEARLKISTQGRFNDRLSVQHVLSCSVYNQGCDGGYAYLALKFGQEVELLPESCMPYRATTGSCQDRCDRRTLKNVYKVRDYKYIGGSYGRCNEYDMMKEVYQNGPIVVSFEPDYLFMHYKTGIYHTVGNTWLTRRENKPIWTKVDHSVVLVGWGFDEESQTKYWILQNSWGANWGENGFFKMVRGIDHLGIESICESGIPYEVPIN